MPQENQTEAGLNVIVRTQDAREVSLTAYGRAWYEKPDFTRGYRPDFTFANVGPLPSHGEMRFRIPLSRLYDLSCSGIYTVEVKQWVLRRDGHRVAVMASPPLKFAMADGPYTFTLYPTNPMVYSDDDMLKF